MLIDKIKDTHDREIVEIRIKAREEKIELILSETDSVAQKVLEFHDVIEARLEGIYFQNVILDITEDQIESFLIKNIDDFKERKRGLLNLEIMFDSYEDYNRYLLENHYKLFSILASVGLNGWIICKDIFSMEGKCF